MIPNKSSLFSKIPTGYFFCCKKKIKYLLFGLKTKISPKILLSPLKNVFFCCLDPDPNWEKIPGSGFVKNESGSATLQCLPYIVIK